MKKNSTIGIFIAIIIGLVALALFIYADGRGLDHTGRNIGTTIFDLDYRYAHPGNPDGIEDMAEGHRRSRHESHRKDTNW